MTIHGKIKQWEREEEVRLIQEFGLPQDAQILDYGCGFGHYTLAASRSLGGGRETTFPRTPLPFYCMEKE
jgi:ubiquinone/menaquinone biosynthesis C-methylase UbiE